MSWVLIFIIGMIITFITMVCAMENPKIKHKKLMKKDAFIYSLWEHKTWGNTIQWMDWEKREIVGWLQRRPEKGDILRCKMESGKIAIFEFMEIDYKRDPSDMFFATVSDLGYEE